MIIRLGSRQKMNLNFQNEEQPIPDITKVFHSVAFENIFIQL